MHDQFARNQRPEHEDEETAFVAAPVLRRGGIALACVIVAFSATVARAQAGPVGAREHYERGSKAFDLGFYEDAIREYMLAYRLKDDPALLYNLGQANRLAGHLHDALRFYRLYLTKLPGAPERDEVRLKIDELQRAVAQQQKAQTELPPDQVLTPLKVAEPAAASHAAVQLTAKPPAPAHKRAWVWGTVAGGVVVVGAAVALGVVFGRSEVAPTPSLGAHGVP
jgi:tetratricopeptide (TPR) repeat protein